MILVTGGTGHTGKRLVRQLLARGDDVRVLSRHPGRLAAEVSMRIEIAVADLTEGSQAAAAAAGCDCVIALSHIKFAPAVLAMMQAANIRRAVFMSSTRRFTRFPEETAGQVIAGEDAVRASDTDWT